MTKRRRKKRYHTGIHNSPKAGDCSYRSGWELLLMNALDSDKTVETYQYEGMTIEYISNAKTGRIRRYIPDFLVSRTDGSKELIEVKPSKRLVQRNIQKKITAAEEWCRAHGVTFKVITEHDLRAMGLM